MKNTNDPQTPITTPTILKLNSFRDISRFKAPEQEQYLDECSEQIENYCQRETEARARGDKNTVTPEKLEIISANFRSWAQAVARMTEIETLKDARLITGNLTVNRKMPGNNLGGSAWDCRTGSKLARIKGSVCENCYARKGFYGFRTAPNETAYQKKAAGIRHPLWVSSMIMQLERNATKHGSGYKFRYDDTGDLQSVEHLAKIVEVAEALPQISFWLPTKEAKDVLKFVNSQKAAGKVDNFFPENLTIRKSAPMVGQTISPSNGALTSAVIPVQNKLAHLDNREKVSVWIESLGAELESWFNSLSDKEPVKAWFKENDVADLTDLEKLDDKVIDMICQAITKEGALDSKAFQKYDRDSLPYRIQKTDPVVLNFLTAEIAAAEDKLKAAGGTICPASNPLAGGSSCNSTKCSMCWGKDQKAIAYIKH